MYTLIVNGDKPNVYINFMRIRKEICEGCKADMSRTYVRDENRQFVPLGWHCPKCKFQRDSNEISTKTQPTTVPTKSDSEKGLEERLAIMTIERDDYRDALSKLMEEHPERTFQNASLMKNDSLTINTTWNVIEDIKFPADKLANFFKAQMHCKQFMTLKIEDSKVVGWESN